MDFRRLIEEAIGELLYGRRPMPQPDPGPNTDYQRRLEEAPLYTEPLLGWRRWICSRRPGGVVLEGLWLPVPWRPGENVARCEIVLARKQWNRTGMSNRNDFPWQEDLPVHDAPHPDCGCGFYALHRPPRYRPTSTIGIIAGYGRVEVHKTGWRAEKAKIIVMNNPIAAAQYGVELAASPERMVQIARKHGRFAEEAEWAS